MKIKLFFSQKLMLLAILFFNAILAQAQNTQVTISNIKSSKGQILLSVFNDDESYNSNKPSKKFVFAKKNIINGSMLINMTIEEGVFGFALLDDENTNNSMDKNLIGIPKEGFGFSNFYLEKMKKPSFNDFKFQSKSKNQIAIKIKYL